MTRLTSDWLVAADTQAVCALLTDSGHRALFVGGCVRNTLLGEPVNDIDLATDALPQRVMDLAEAAGMKAIPTGIDHGTVTLVPNGRPFEVTTFRRDVSTDGRRATVAFSRDVTEDARRRDFTMNALYADATGRIIDPLDGLSDLKQRRVRFIEDPEHRIREDFLRILRFFRFFAWYGGEAGIDPDGLAACAELAHQIGSLSAERVTAEVLKLLAAPDPAPAAAAMEVSGVLMRVIPGASTGLLSPLVHVEKSAGVSPDPIRRLVALGGETQHLRLSKAEARFADLLRSGMDVEEAAYRHGADSAISLALLRSATENRMLETDLARRIGYAAAATFPLSAADFMPALNGPDLGAALKTAEARWIASGFTLSRSDLLK